ncbi:MAG: hypothetical protein GY739_21495, partial [Mesoflavibacter sp.]|nr:hypothetical protein [Mesoflavibacter sp.]
MPITIYSKTEQEKFDSFVSRLYQGLEIQGKTENELRVVPKPNPHI